MIRSVLCIVTIVVLLILAAPAIAQPSPKVETIVSLWGAFNADTTLRYVEAMQYRNRWIVDVVYMDYGSPALGDLQIGGGRRVLDNGEGSFLDTIVYLDIATGSESNGERWIIPAFSGAMKLTGTIVGEAALFYYIPIRENAPRQLFIDRVKVEYDPGSWWKAGVGYAALDLEGRGWEHRPLVTFTAKTTDYGWVELWYQRLDQTMSGASYQIQARYNILF